MLALDEGWEYLGGNLLSWRECCTSGIVLVVYKGLFNPHQSLILRVRNFAGKERV